MLMEVIQFKLKAETDEAEFLRANKQAEEQQVATIPGFLSRQTTVDDDNWMINVHWVDKDALDKSLATFMESPATQSFLALIDSETMKINVFTVKM